MQTVGQYLPLQPQTQASTSPPDPIRASIAHLLSRAHSLPCSASSQAFAQLVPPTSRFQLALDVLLPLLNPPHELAHRILVSYILYSLYAPHSIEINPFKSALFAAFVKEKESAIGVADGGGVSENEQLVWVLWKILRGDGNDIGPYSPTNLARSPLPPKLRASNLFLDDEKYIQEPNNNTHHHDKSSINTSILSREHSPKGDGEDEHRKEAVSHAMKLLLAARERVLRLSEQRILTPLIPDLLSPPMIASLDLNPLICTNPSVAYHLLIALLTLPPARLSTHSISIYLDVLRHLPPTLPSFDILGRLIRDPAVVTDFTTGGTTTVADLVREEVLGRFVHECTKWLDNAEREEQEGLISDDRFAKGVQHLCRFYMSLLKHGIVDVASDADCAEMAHFSLRNARFEEANSLYRLLAMGRI